MFAKSVMRNHVLMTIFILLISAPLHATHIMLIGGALSDNNASIFNGLMKSTGKKWTYDLESMNHCLTNWKMTSCPKIAVVTSASENLAAGIDAFNKDDLIQLNSLSYYHLFQKWGFSPKHVQIAVDNYLLASKNGNPVGDANIEIIREADIVFFNGGDQSRHSKSWLNNDGSDRQIMWILRNRIMKNEVVIAGTSAGTAVQGKIIYGEGNSFGYLTINELAPKPVDSLTGLLDDRMGDSGFQFENNGGMMTGFSFLSRNIAFDTHFEARARLGRMLVAMENLKTNFGVGIDEDTALFLNDDRGIVYGTNHVFIVDTRLATHSLNSQHFNITGAVINVLSEGDKFNFKFNSLETTRPKIRVPQYKSGIDSNNIFGEYEATNLITHLVDQETNMNNGYSDIDHPGFHFQFSKDQFTSGYFSNNQYTVEKVKMDILDY